MIEVSVIIPTYNRKTLLRRALDSVLKQKDVVFEVIVIDDGSADGTDEMIAKNYPQVTYAAFPNQGPAAARNRGIEMARGEWIAFLDSDDEWLDGKLIAQLNFLSVNPALLICQTEEIWVRNGRRVNAMNKHRKYGGRIFEKCLPLCIISPSAAMMHRTLFEHAGLFDESFPACEDYDLWLRISVEFPVGLIEKPFIVKYGGHADQRSHEFPAMDRFRIQALVKLLNSGKLNPEQREAAQKTLAGKAAIFIQGAIKRGKTEEAETVKNLCASNPYVSSF